MLPTDELFLTTLRLQGDACLLHETRDCLREVLDRDDFSAWHNSLEQAHPFEVTDLASREVLRCAGLLAKNRLAVRLNRHEGLVFTTDGTWVPAGLRVFPFSDESHTLLEFVRRRGLLAGTGLLVDLAGGCGHTAWAAEATQRVCMDLNPRALAYAALNRMLNELPAQHCTVVLNDVHAGIPPMLAAAPRTLVTGNLPFGVAANTAALPLTSNGGSDGMALQRAALSAFAAWEQRHARQAQMTLVLLGLSLGDAGDDRWCLRDLALDNFAPHRVEWQVLTQEQLARANGSRTLPNPCPVEQALPALARCRLYTPGRQARQHQVEVATALAREHARRGLADIAYGVLTIRP